ncbi:hypothetical protein ACFLYP_00035 [Chloroflexota bacterium]
MKNGNSKAMDCLQKIVSQHSNCETEQRDPLSPVHKYKIIVRKECDDPVNSSVDENILWNHENGMIDLAFEISDDAGLKEVIKCVNKCTNFEIIAIIHRADYEGWVPQAGRRTSRKTCTRDENCCGEHNAFIPRVDIA